MHDEQVTDQGDEIEGVDKGQLIEPERVKDISIRVLVFDTVKHLVVVNVQDQCGGKCPDFKIKRVKQFKYNFTINYIGLEAEHTHYRSREISPIDTLLLFEVLYKVVLDYNN